MSPKEPVNIIILGGSFAGISVAHAFLRKTYDELSRQYESNTKIKAPRFRVILVSPSTHFFWNIAAPRALVSPKSVPHSKSFTPILEAFEDYPEGRFTFIQGTASALDTNACKVDVTLCGEDLAFFLQNKSSRADSGTGKETWEGNVGTSKTITKQISYHALIIATGTSAESPLLSLHGEHKKTIEAFDSFHAKIQNAASIIIAGGGTSGVECAGQLATFLGGKQDISQRSSTDPNSKPLCSRRAVRSRFKRRKSSPMVFPKSKSTSNSRIVTLISGNDRLLPNMSPKASELAESQLRKLGVNIMHNTRLVTAQELPSGQTRCVLSDDLSISCDLFVACTGVYPNTTWLPRDLLDTNGYIKTNAETLRVPSGGERIYAIGDCTDFSKKSLNDVYDALPILMQNLQNDLLARGIWAQRHTFKDIGYFLDRLTDATYVRKKTMGTFIPVTRWGGVGLVNGRVVPSWYVWAVKGRDFGTEKGVLAARMGENPWVSGSYFMGGR
ncbi:FAD/NAD(P)-binding domain-containing protein [Venturia nashicola]|uniref:FAD/NAD(P)-binding domain-containing protein n=1 Tax=Venturia nashicola TaxID=86259 RepID=A0A4Z1PCM5_9PEZI|nr:FAD/NAD(P)-binding domain-containing protein [Venturia nashicola]TLD35590.1 FAD/NAD(P)-binding domain-containing protein [Venturia nashicola]